MMHGPLNVKFENTLSVQCALSHIDFCVHFDFVCRNHWFPNTQISILENNIYYAMRSAKRWIVTGI